MRQATHCLAKKGFLPYSESKALTFGYLVDDKSYPGKTLLYVVNYPNRSKSEGSVFTLVLANSGGRQDFSIQNNARFVEPAGGRGDVSFVAPPLGGSWTQAHLVSAIRKIEKQPNLAISARDMRAVDSSADCEAYSDALPGQGEPKE
ncbi:hypothetical protein [Dyella mobilis]|uniref:Uncharacterized protein n=1 Tax=Dyella mobilis TaxID=1849582 RepID=A0ABS2KJS0_9GAMM|nr:hypothetical protein [Dyella mobilis]MBM7130658.1 hypothetical protein [Dyella mobilis]GLQ97282.1 hypothetical protein GCM10007863_17020 [Dyella mobilis]